MSPLRRNGSFGESHAWQCGLKALRVLVTCSTPHFDGPAAPAPVTSSRSVRRRCGATSSRTCRERARGSADVCHLVVSGAEELAHGRGHPLFVCDAFAPIDLLPIVGPPEGRVFRPLVTPAGWLHRRDHEGYRGLVADGSLRSILVIVLAPIVQLFPGVGNGQKPVRVQAFGA
jgi:hypothetical protein